MVRLNSDVLANRNTWILYRNMLLGQLGRCNSIVHSPLLNKSALRIHKINHKFKNNSCNYSVIMSMQ